MLPGAFVAQDSDFTYNRNIKSMLQWNLQGNKS